MDRKLRFLSLIVFTAFTLSLSNTHTFYYLWYGDPAHDTDYKHWNHEVLPHWENRINERFSSKIGTKHNPPSEIHSPYYPYLGPYSSRDPEVISHHFDLMEAAGIQIAVLSWWGQAANNESRDTQGVSTDLILMELLNVLERRGNHSNVKLAFHLEPYHSRSISSIKRDVEYIYDKYGSYKCIYKDEAGKMLFYVYDSYHIRVHDWQTLLQPEGMISLRGSRYDSLFIGLWLNHEDGRNLLNSGFDGVYTYFASNGFSYGSSTLHWKEITSFCKTHKMLCSLSVGPGYDDEGIRPWNAHNTKDRMEGKYYEYMWKAAMEARPDFVSITSWNEWGEGTQIEPASTSAQIDQHIQNLVSDFNSQNRKIYRHYPQEDPFFYTNLTKTYSAKFIQDKSAASYSQPPLVSSEISTSQSFEKESTNNVKIRKNNGILEYL